MTVGDEEAPAQKEQKDLQAPLVKMEKLVVRAMKDQQDQQDRLEIVDLMAREVNRYVDS